MQISHQPLYGHDGHLQFFFQISLRDGRIILDQVQDFGIIDIIDIIGIIGYQKSNHSIDYIIDIIDIFGIIGIIGIIGMRPIFFRELPVHIHSEVTVQVNKFRLR